MDQQTIVVPDDARTLTEEAIEVQSDDQIAHLVTTDMQAEAQELARHVGEPIRQELTRLAKASASAETAAMPEFGITTPTGYKYLDCMTYGPVNMTIPPYLPRKIVARGAPLLLIGYLWVNPALGPGGSLPGTKVLAGDRYQARIEVIKKGGGLAKAATWTGQFSAPVPTVQPFLYWTTFNDEGRYEFCFSFDDREPTVPLAAFSNWHYEPDPDMGFFGLPTIPAGWRRSRGEFGVITV